MKFSLKILSLLLSLSLLTGFTACRKSYDDTRADFVTDYSRPEHWLSIPDSNTKDVDIFYLYPTAWYKEDDSEPNYCAIDNRIMLIGSQQAFDRQATAFETVGNIYAPYYRQALANYTLSLPEDERWKAIEKIPARDVKAAFDYYIKNFNNGRPFILVGHSQGAMTTVFLLKDYMADNPDVYQRMICAYVIGYPVTSEFIAANSHLKFAQGADDVGVIISFNTQSPTIAPGENIITKDTVGLVINPINWKRDETLATVEENLGSYMPDNGNYAIVQELADARIDLAQGVIICSSVDENEMFELSDAMGLGVYHSFDIPFYYKNLRANAEERVAAYLNQ